MTAHRVTLANTFMLLALLAAPAQAQGYIEEWSGAETVMDETMLTAADRMTSPAAETANQYYSPQFNSNAYYPYQQAAQPQQQYAPQQPYSQQQQFPQYAAQQYQQYYYQLNNPMASPLPATPQQQLVTPASMAGSLPAWQPASNSDPSTQKSKSGRWQSLVNAVSNSSSNVLPLLNSVLQRL